MNYLKKILRKFKKKKINHILGNNNKIIIIKDGIETVVNDELISGLSININGNNNTIKIEQPIAFENSSIIISESDNAEIEIKKTQYHIHNFQINSRLHKGHKLFIDEDFYCNGAAIFLREENASVTIGKDCMFSWGINIFTSDGHCIFDKDTKELLNNPSLKIKIGNHVWLGRDAEILKNAQISDNTVVGSKACVVNKHTEENLILAGIPAKTIKRNINWSREFITDYKGN